MIGAQGKGPGQDYPYGGDRHGGATDSPEARWPSRGLQYMQKREREGRKEVWGWSRPALQSLRVRREARAAETEQEQPETWEDGDCKSVYKEECQTAPVSLTDGQER